MRKTVPFLASQVASYGHFDVRGDPKSVWTCFAEYNVLGMPETIPQFELGLVE